MRIGRFVVWLNYSCRCWVIGVVVACFVEHSNSKKIQIADPKDIVGRELIDFYINSYQVVVAGTVNAIEFFAPLQQVLYAMVTTLILLSVQCICLIIDIFRSKSDKFRTRIRR